MKTIEAVRRALPLLLLALASPAFGQDGPPSGERPGPGAIERLEEVRLERMRQALELSEAEVEALRVQMREGRETMLAALAEQREAMERLEALLGARPVDQEAVRRAMETLEARRELFRTLRDRHRENLGSHLSPEKRARILLFNERFDRRLRELMARHRASGVDGRTPDGPSSTPRR